MSLSDLLDAIIDRFSPVNIGAVVTDEQVCYLQGKVPVYDDTDPNNPGKIICVDPNKPLTPSGNFDPKPAPKINPKPKVSTPPQIIYRDREVIREIEGEPEIVYIDRPVYIEAPRRRLKQSNIPVDTKSTQTEPGKTIKIQYQIDEAFYGNLLHEPFSSQNIRFKVCNENDFENRFTTNQIAAATNYILAIHPDTNEEEPNEQLPEPKKSVTDLGVALINRNFNTFIPSSTKITPIFSCQGINELIGYYLNKNLSNFRVTSTIPASYSTVNHCEGAIYPAPNEQIAEIFEYLTIGGAKITGEFDLELLEKIAAAIGVDDFPFTVPQSLVTQLDDETGQPQENGTEVLTSLIRVWNWYIKRFDEIVGQFEIPIKIKDTDLVQPGDQSKTIKLPNIAESIAEMFMLNFQSLINTETLINMCTRILFEGGQDKQQNFITYKLLYSLVDWAGYKTKDVADEMPLLFTPDKTKLSDILKETKIKVGTQVLDEKYGLEIDLMRFRKAAGIIDAVHFRKINPFADIAPQIMAYLLGAKDTSDKLNDDAVDDEFEQFIEDVETGFQNVPAVTNPELPYGKPFEQRPRIRDLTPPDQTTP